MRERMGAEARAKRLALRNKDLVVIDAGTFHKQLQSLAVTMTNLVEREGHKKLPHRFMNADLTMILRTMTETYNLLSFINSDENAITIRGIDRATALSHYRSCAR